MMQSCFTRNQIYNKKKEVSAMLSVLPLKMDAIRASQDTMLAREELYERKRKSKYPVAETVSAPKKPNVGTKCHQRHYPNPQR